MSKIICSILGNLVTKSLIILFVVGLANVWVNNTTLPCFFDTASRSNKTSDFKSSHEESCPLILGVCILLVSYKDKTDACTLALALQKSDASLLLSIFIGLPSRVFTKILAKSNPSAIAVA